MVQTYKRSKILKITLAVFAFSVLAAPTVNAQTAAKPDKAPKPAESACDPEYYKSLESRAWLEAQREVTQNQNLIFKPDSVLEYTCFDQYLTVLASNAKNMFSESQSGWGKPVGKTGSMKNALQNTVGDTVKAYIKSNFEDPETYPLLGGRAKGVDYKVKNVKTGGSYNCDMMNKIWAVAKCMDFAAEKHDGFFTFANYMDSDDKRVLPTQCDAIKDRWTKEHDTALLTDKTPWIEDIVETHFDLLDPEKCTGANTIETGLTINPGVSTQYKEKVCLPPGCYYDSKDKKCVPSKKPKAPSGA